jgi:N-acetylmuramoyl-L-alanine amidase
MAQSVEYPELPFIPPRAWGSGRDGKAVRYSVIHYTAGAERNTSAEDGAAYDQRRTDGTSTHFFHDADSTVQCVLTKDRANAARHRGNRLGIQHELCGTVQTREQWLDAQSLPTLRRAAYWVARDCLKYGLEPRRLSVAEVRQAWTEFPDGPRGICGHVDVTYAYPEDDGDHTDPGSAFPWDLFLAMVRGHITQITGGDMAGEADAAFSKPYTGTEPWVSGSSWVAKALELPLRQVKADLAEVKEAVAALTASAPPSGGSSPVPVIVADGAADVIAESVAASLKGDPQFLSAVAKAVNDDAARRSAE